MVIVRELASEIQKAATWAPSITITGPRQSGKTTFCQAVFPEQPFRSLEAPDERAFAEEDPKGFLAQFPRGAVLDEVQRAPDLLSYLQGIIDADPVPGRWILNGSHSPDLIESVARSLTGRTALHHLLPLSWDEARRFPRHPAGLDEALFTGGYPRIFDRGVDPSDWLRTYVSTYIERDVGAFSRVGDLSKFQRFVELCAGRTAQLLNYSSLADDCGISQPTAKAWFRILEGSFIAFRIPAFKANLRKRLAKMPKLYFYDTGLACWLLGIRETGQLRAHPLRGPLFETWVVSEVLKHRLHRGRRGGLSFYRDSRGTELDLIVNEPGVLTLVEAKSGATAKSNFLNVARRVRRIVLGVRPFSDLLLVYGGEEFQQLPDSRVVPWRMVRSIAPPRLAPAVHVFAEGKPLPRSNVLVLFPDTTWKSAMTDEQGCARLVLRPGHLPLTVFVARKGFAARVETGWVPDERALHVHLAARPGGGSRIVTGVVPGIPVDIDVQGLPICIELIAGEATVRGISRAEAPIPAVPGSGYTRELALSVVKVVGEAALLDYRLGGASDRKSLPVEQPAGSLDQSGRGH